DTAVGKCESEDDGFDRVGQDAGVDTAQDKCRESKRCQAQWCGVSDRRGHPSGRRGGGLHFFCGHHGSPSPESVPAITGCDPTYPKPGFRRTKCRPNVRTAENGAPYRAGQGGVQPLSLRWSGVSATTASTFNGP